MVTSYPGQQDKEGSGGPDTGHSGRQAACLLQSPHPAAWPLQCQPAVWEGLGGCQWDKGRSFYSESNPHV